MVWLGIELDETKGYKTWRLMRSFRSRHGGTRDFRTVCTILLLPPQGGVGKNSSMRPSESEFRRFQSSLVHMLVRSWLAVSVTLEQRVCTASVAIKHVRHQLGGNYPRDHAIAGEDQTLYKL